MKRIAVIVLALLAGALALGASSDGSDSERVRVDALFDNAAGVVSDQHLKVAGVPVGTVLSVELTEDRLARVHLEVDPRFAPFRTDAECEVKAESLIGERFVQCDPGSPDGTELTAPDGEVPTVPVERNSSPIDLDLVFGALRRPYTERLQIILNELGAGVAGRGEDINELIRRANPALDDAQDLLAEVNAQRGALRSAIADTDTILASVADHPDELGDFIDSAAAVSERAGSRDDELEQTTERLPGLLSEAEPALRNLDKLAVDATPLVQDLRRSAPGAARLFKGLGPFARASRPTLARLGEAAVPGSRAFVDATPTAGSLRRTTAALRPIVPTLVSLTDSLVAKGGTEGLARFFYNAALATSRFDAVSHMLPAHALGGACLTYHAAEPPIDGCSGRFRGGVRSGDAGKRNKGAGLSSKPGAASAIPELDPPQAGSAPGADAAVPQPGSAAAPPASPQQPGAPGPSTNAVGQLLDFLLGGGG